MSDIDASKLNIMFGWLVYETGQHTCAGGGPESSGAHEPGCGYEPLITVEQLGVALSEYLARQAPEPVLLPADFDPFSSEVPASSSRTNGDPTDD